MANGAANPLAAPLTTLKQIGEQANQSIQSLGSGIARSASQGIDAIIQGAPALPGMPGGKAGGAAFPSLKSLMPANLTQALSQIENVIIPPGLPKPSQAFKGAAAAPTPAAPSPAAPASIPTPETATAISGRRRIKEIGGV